MEKKYNQRPYKDRKTRKLTVLFFDSIKHKYEHKSLVLFIYKDR